MSETPLPAPKRPTLLTVLCILSLLGNIYSLWSGYQSAFTDAPRRQLEKTKAQRQEIDAQFGSDTPMIGMMDTSVSMAESAAKHAKPIGYATIAVSLLSLIGVGFMWNLRKAGFWLYLLASIVGGIITAMFMRDGTGILGNIVTGLYVIVSAVFVVLYAMNLKHMR